jgi:ribosomal protein S18 acetylase RimI-like enzyme
VHSDWRNNGAGRYLVDHIKQYAETNGYCKINLEVREDNSKARSLYNKVGFRATNPAMLFWELQL